LRKTSRLVFNRLGVLLLLISVVFLSATRQVLPFTEQTITLAYPEALPATYPKLIYSTYLGGNAMDGGNSIAVTSDGSCYVTGGTRSSDFPIRNAFDSTYNDGFDAFISKFNVSGFLLWSTFLGGNKTDGGYSIAVTSDGSCYVTGQTGSSDFPTLNAYNSTYGGNDDAFLAKFSSSGQLLWSTYLGGSKWDEGHSIAVAGDGSCYVTGNTRSEDFPTKNAFDSTPGGLYDGFVAKFSTNGTLLWSSYLGGNAMDGGNSIAVTSDGSCYVTGYTGSSDFPTLYAFNDTISSTRDSFVAKFTGSGLLLWSTFFGGSGLDYGYDISVAGDDSCYITGYTGSIDFPQKNALNSTLGGHSDAFVSKFSFEGSLLWSTFLGGSVTDRGYAIAVTSDGSCYVTGETFSSNFPTLNAYNSTLSSGADVFISKFNASGFLLWSTYLGGSEVSDKGFGIAVTEDGSCYVTGRTNSDDFPTQNAYDYTLGGSSDAFVTKFDDSPLPIPPRPLTVTGFLVFVAVMIFATLPVIALIVYKKQK